MPKYITDKSYLFKIWDDSTELVKAECVATNLDSELATARVGQVFTFHQDAVNRAEMYDPANPICVKINTGKCFCAQCNKELFVGDSCLRDTFDTVYCSEECFIQANAEEDTIYNSDLDDSSTMLVPLFDYSEE